LPVGHELRDVPLDNMRSDAIGVFERQILHAAREVARRPRMLADTPAARPDTLDPAIKAVPVNRNGIETIEYYGESFVRKMSRPGRRVASFWPPSYA
jgi:hypothetical protein